MSISDLNSIKKAIMAELVVEDKKSHDEFRDGVCTGLTMALMRIERMIEEEDERMVAEYKDFL